MLVSDCKWVICNPIANTYFWSSFRHYQPISMPMPPPPPPLGLPLFRSNLGLRSRYRFHPLLWAIWNKGNPRIIWVDLQMATPRLEQSEISDGVLGVFIPIIISSLVIPRHANRKCSLQLCCWQSEHDKLWLLTSQDGGYTLILYNASFRL